MNFWLSIAIATVFGVNAAISAAPEDNANPSPTAVTKEEVKEATKKTSNFKEDDEGFQKLINNYKTYLTKVTPEIRKEISTYRSDVGKLNKEKKKLYGKLSVGAQNHLKREQAFKKKLFIQHRKFLKKVDID